MSNHRIHARPPKAPRRNDWYVFWPVWAICGGFVLLLIFVLVSAYVSYPSQKSDVPVVTVGEGQDLHLDTTRLNSRQLHLFEVSSSGQKVKVVVRRRTDDKAVQVALASCRTCYRSHDRHYAKNGQMMCAECNSQMNFEAKGHKPGTNGCALVEIPHMQTSGNITVLLRDVLAQAAKMPQ